MFLKIHCERMSASMKKYTIFVLSLFMILLHVFCVKSFVSAVEEEKSQISVETKGETKYKKEAVQVQQEEEITTTTKLKTTESTTAATTTTQRSTTRSTTRRNNTTTTTESTTTEPTTAASETTTLSSETTVIENSNQKDKTVLKKDTLLSIVSWGFIGLGVIFVLLVVFSGKRRSNSGFQKGTNRYKNKSRYSSYSNKYRSNIKRK